MTMQPPPPIAVSEPDSFALHTMTRRLPDLCRRVIVENNFSEAIEANLIALAAELLEGEIIPIADGADDVAAWQGYLQPYWGKRWLDLPWYFAEAYFYRRLLQAIDYVHTQHDPYTLQKRLGIEHSLDAIDALSQQTNEMQGHWQPTNLIALLYGALWGNRVDLSLRPAQQGMRYEVETQHEAANLLVDDSEAIVTWLEQHAPGRIDLIIDNAGLELFCDLCLADYLLSSQIVSQVRFHLKAQPIFVSDAMPKDVYGTIEQLQPEASQAIQSLLSRLQSHLASDRLQLQTHPFWTSPLVFWEMPGDLRQTLKQASLVIVKGDANYRRLLGDRHWAFTTPFADITSYFPTPLTALRTLKSELACGLSGAQIAALNSSDPAWLTNGKRGVIQFAALGHEQAAHSKWA